MIRPNSAGYQLKLIFSCDCENEKLKNAPTIGEVFKSSRLISSIAGIKAVSPECIIHEGCAEVFQSCGFDTDDIKRLVSASQFSIEKMFYPYGLIVGFNEQFNDLGAISDWLKKFDCHFKLHNVSNFEDNRAEWIIYDYPIIVIEYYGAGDAQFESFFIDNLGCPMTPNMLFDKKIFVCDPIICVQIQDEKDMVLYDNLYQIVEVIAAIKHLNSDMRMSLGKIAKSEEKPKKRRTKNEKGERANKKKATEQDPLLSIQKKCAVVNELNCKNIFHNSQQRRLYQFLHDAFDVDGILKQVESAKIFINYMGETHLREETSAIDRTLFVTGYLGLILSVFALFSIKMNKILRFPAASPTIWFSLVECAGLIALVVAISIFLVFCYKKIMQREKYRKIFKGVLFLLGIVFFVYLIYCIVAKFCW